MKAWRIFGILLLMLVSIKPVAAKVVERGQRSILVRRAVISFKEMEQLQKILPPPLHRLRVAPAPGPMPKHFFIPPQWIKNSEPQGLRPSRFFNENIQPLSSPAPAASFQGVLDDDYMVPPDTMGAVGLNDVMETVNSQVEVLNRTGQVLGLVDEYTFWYASGAVDSSDMLTDPHLIYDPYNNRWVFIILDIPGIDNIVLTNPTILIAVSQTGDPLGNWSFYYFVASQYLAADYPCIGFNSNWIVITGNILTSYSGGSSFDHSNIWVIDKTGLYLNLPNVSAWRFQSTSQFTLQPALTYDNTEGTEYLLSNLTGNYNNSYIGYLVLNEIAGAFDNPLWYSKIAYPSDPSLGPWADFPPYPNFLPQSGSSEGVAPDDSRLGDCVYRNGSLWTCQTVFLPATSPFYSAVQWWQIDPSTGNVLQDGQVTTSGFPSYAYPSIAVNQNNDVLLGYSTFSSFQYPSAGYSFRYSTDPPGTMETPTTLKNGEAPYYKEGRTRNRWGDYSATVVDPTNDTDMWTLQEYASSGNHWGTWWGYIALPSGLSVSVIPNSVPGGNTANGIVQLSSPAPAGGEVVTLKSSLPTIAKVPENVTVMPKATEATFPIITNSVDTNTSVTVSATAIGNTATTRLAVIPSQLRISFNPSQMISLGSAEGIVTLPQPAPVSGATITVASDNPSVLAIPKSVTIPYGRNSVSFMAISGLVLTPIDVKITADYKQYSAQANVTVWGQGMILPIIIIH